MCFNDLAEGLRENNGCLEELSFHDCAVHGAVDFDTIVSLAPNLTNLQVSDDVFFRNGREFVYTRSRLLPVARLKHLTHLNLQGNFAVNDRLIRDLVVGCPKLTHLDLTGIRWGREGLIHVVELPQLASLRLSHLLVVDDEFLKIIAKKLKGLEQLYLISCRITDEGCSEILNHCASLNLIDISECHLVTREIVNTAIKLMWSTNILRPRLHIMAGETAIRHEDRFFEPDVLRRVRVVLSSGEQDLHDEDTDDSDSEESPDSSDQDSCYE